MPKIEYKKLENLALFCIREVVEQVKTARLDLWVDTAIAFRLMVNYMYVMLLGFCRISLSYSS
jgi:methionine synthase II (cobalamin-independent)